MLQHQSNILTYPSKRNSGGYSYDQTESNSTYPPCRYILNQFKGSLAKSARELLEQFNEFDNEAVRTDVYPGLKQEQNDGVNKILKMKRAILCDEVGNGKTLQALTVANELGGNILYITKKTLITQVEEEIRKWYPNIVIHTNLQSSSPGIYVTNYEQLSLMDRKELKRRRKLLIIDEAHSVKNRTAKRSKMVALVAHNSEYLILLTGTPIEKLPNDMWHLMHLLDKDIWSSYWRWANYFTDYDVLPSGVRVNIKPKNVNVFHSILTSYYIRRESNRPTPNYIDVPVKLYKSQRDLYDLINKEAYIPPYDLTIQNEISRQVYLRQLAIESSWLTGDTNESAKLNKCDELIQKHLNENIVIFCSFNRPLEILHNSITHLYRTGDVIDFNTKPILLMTYQSGGTGLNLQDAHIAILLDLPQSSIIFQQAIGRLNRIGQQITPTFYIIRADNTIDKRVNKLMENKLEVFKDLVRESK